MRHEGRHIIITPIIFIHISLTKQEQEEENLINSLFLASHVTHSNYITRPNNDMYRRIVELLFQVFLNEDMDIF